MKKPDVVTVVSRGNYRSTAWDLPVSDLLYVGPATARKLLKYSVRTIGDLARMDPDFLLARLGKNGLMLWRFANGEDGAKVMPQEYVAPVKSIGHGTTCVHDLETDYEVWLVLYELAQDVGRRLRVDVALAVESFADGGSGHIASLGDIRDRDHAAPFFPPHDGALKTI